MRVKWMPGTSSLLLGVALILGGCQQPPPPRTVVQDAVPVDGVGYLVFNAPIIPSSRDLLIADIEKLRQAGAREIRIGMNSPGGDIDSAQAIVDDMGRQHVENGITFKAYNIGVVASAATFVFLNAQNRYTLARGAFLFHAAGAIANGPMNAQTLRDQADKLDHYERIVRATLKAKTRLTDAEAVTYVRRTVILNSDDARRDGVVEAITDFPVPKAAHAWIITLRPTARPQPQPQPQPQPN